jgi:hypothetical protein
VLIDEVKTGDDTLILVTAAERLADLVELRGLEDELRPAVGALENFLDRHIRWLADKERNAAAGNLDRIREYVRDG